MIRLGLEPRAPILKRVQRHSKLSCKGLSVFWNRQLSLNTWSAVSFCQRRRHYHLKKINKIWNYARLLVPLQNENV